MIQIIDISYQVLLNKQKAYNKLLGLINATISHELRNPLNSILAINQFKIELYKEIEEILYASQVPDYVKVEEVKEKLIILQNEQAIQDSSASLMKYLIQDLLDYSQIKNKKFRKNMKNFNLKQTIKEIMSIFQLKADS